MPVDFPFWVYEPCFETFARSITYYPVVSQPGVGGYAARGIFDTNETDVVGMDGSIYTDARTELDIFMPEWSTYPRQGDLVYIPMEADVDGGNFIVTDVQGKGNAGGELTLTLGRYEEAKMPGYLVTTASFSVSSLDFAKPVLS